MSSEEDRNGKDIDELEMFESLDDSDVVLDTFTIEKKTKISALGRGGSPTWECKEYFT